MNRVLQWFLSAPVTRTLVRAGVAATALGFSCTVAAEAHTFPVGPILLLMEQTETSAGTPRAARNDAAAAAEPCASVQAEAKCGDSIPDGEAASASPSVTAVTIQSLQLGRTEPQSGAGRGGMQSLEPSVMNEPGIAAASPLQPPENPSFHWGSAIRQSLLFLAISHAFRFSTEPSTRAEFKGPFWSDYFNSVKHLRGWGDGDEFTVNYIGHPMEGSVAGYIQIQNDPKGILQEVGFNKAYWVSRLKACGWAAAFSTQYEIGLVSEASLGNVGLEPSKKSNHPMGYVDLVVTPVLGTAWLVGEDLLDRYVIQRVENRVKNRLVRLLVRSFLNPTRSFANMHRGQWFWHRDDRPLRAGL